MKYKGIYYLSANEKERAWGLYSTGVGHGLYAPFEKYPASVHARKYLEESWEKGRVLSEYQCVYIHKGRGKISYKSKEGKEKYEDISSGCLFILKPNMWHTYSPNKNTGWEEYWVGFNGDWATNIFNDIALNSNTVVYHNQNSNFFQVIFEEMLHACKKHSDNPQSELRYRILQCLNSIKETETTTKYMPHLHVINNLKIELENNFKVHIRVEDIVKQYYKNNKSEMRLSYSYFRKLFTEIYGVSPGFFLDRLRLAEAKKLLHLGQMNIKQISHELGFQNPYYFSRFFKKHQGVSPKFFK